jgi:hypothetical protein
MESLGCFTDVGTASFVACLYTPQVAASVRRNMMLLAGTIPRLIASRPGPSLAVCFTLNMVITQCHRNKILDGKFNGRRLVGRSRLRWENIRRDSSFLLNITGCSRLAWDRDI